MNITQLKSQRASLKSSLTRLSNFVESMDSDIDFDSLEVRLERLEKIFDDFCKTQDDLFKMESALPADINESEEAMDKFEMGYMTTKSKLLRQMRHLKPTIGTTVSTNESTANVMQKIKVCVDSELPKVSIPKFTGRYRDWPSFRDAFIGAVDSRKDCTSTQKFYLLRSLLEEKPAKLLKHVIPSDTSYLEVWDCLEKRYDKPVLIVNSFIESFLSISKQSSANSLRNMVDEADEIIRGLRSMKADDRDSWLIYLLLQKVDSTVRSEWVKSIDDDKEAATMQQFLTFLAKYCDSLEAGEQGVRNQRKTVLTTHNVHYSSLSCIKCKENHHLFHCQSFNLLDVHQRREFAKFNRLCFNCMRSNHISTRCNNKSRCRICRSKHHTLLHLNESQKQHQDGVETVSRDEPISCSSQEVLVSSLVNTNAAMVSIFPTAIVKVRDGLGRFHQCRILIDSSSEINMITERLFKKLELPSQSGTINVTGLNHTAVGQMKKRTTIQLFSRFDKKNITINNVCVFPGEISKTPSATFNNFHWEHIKDLQLADPRFNEVGNIDILVGTGSAWQIILSNRVSGGSGVPVALESIFGWIIAGEFNNNFDRNSSHAVLTTTIEDTLSKFWELEEVPSIQYRQGDDEVEQHFVQNVQRAKDGKYVIKLPMKDQFVQFGNSVNGAICRLLAMERRFINNPTLHTMYNEFMREYERMGHMRKLSSEELQDKKNNRIFYMPHHSVYRPDSTTTKLRVVFDGSHKDDKGISLNECLHIGPPIQRELFNVALRFRQYPYVFARDITKMFRMI